MYLPYKHKRLAVSFDAARMAEEVASIPQSSWIFHGFHNTGHKVLPLVSARGTLSNDDGSFNHSLVPPFLPTEHLERMPYIAGILDEFGAKPYRVRLAEMTPGSIITPHRDLHPNWYDKVRLHIPIVTAPEVQCHLWADKTDLTLEDYTAIHMAPGEAWVFNIWHVHAVTNFSQTNRIHLVADFQPQGELFRLMFEDVPKEDIIETMSHRYPRTYRTDRDTLAWLTGGDPELGRRLWNVDVQDTNPQVNAYRYPQRFWDPAAYAPERLTA